jgi:hypothetical protein
VALRASAEGAVVSSYRRLVVPAAKRQRDKRESGGSMNVIGLFGLLMAVLSGQPQAPALQPPKLTLAMTLRVEVGPPMELGEVPRGRRRIIPILGGTFEGPNIRRKVLPGGADWQIVRADGLAELDTR